MSSVFNGSPIWRLTAREVTVCGTLCMWVVFFFCLLIQVCICHLLSSPFVMPVTINLKRSNETWGNIYPHLVKYCIFWIHFEFSSSDAKLKKFCLQLQIGRIVTKFTVSFLFHSRHRRPSYIFLMYLFWILFPDVGSSFHMVQNYPRSFFCILSYANNCVTIAPFHHWVKLLELRLTMGLSLATKMRGKVIRANSRPKGTSGLRMQNLQ